MDERMERRTIETFVGVGANLGDRTANVRRAADRLDALSAMSVVARSSLYETEPRIVEDQPDFVNACLKIETRLDPRKLLDEMFEIEREMGRVRSADHRDKGARSIDLDLLLYGDRVVDEPGLEVPHPGLPDRRFVLVPLVEIAPRAYHPVEDCSAETLLARCGDDGRVHRLET
jgi:2-amino-4-hydroxy-6-hydroxymethyldihydropteridine diphosphokinase